jgi:hypothetical protein
VRWQRLALDIWNPEDFYVFTVDIEPFRSVYADSRLIFQFEEATNNKKTKKKKKPPTEKKTKTKTGLPSKGKTAYLFHRARYWRVDPCKQGNLQCCLGLWVPHGNPHGVGVGWVGFVELCGVGWVIGRVRLVWCGCGVNFVELCGVGCVWGTKIPPHGNPGHLPLVAIAMLAFIGAGVLPPDALPDRKRSQTISKFPCPRQHGLTRD